MGFDRIARLATELTNAGYDAFMAHAPVTMTYLHGFNEDGHERFLTLAIHKSGEVRLICPSLSAIQAARVGVKDIRQWADGEDPMVHFEELARDWNLKTSIVAVDDEMPAHVLLKMQEVLPAALFKSGNPILMPLMRVKTSEEIGLLKVVGAIADEAFDEVLPKIKAGMTEKQVERMLFDAMQARGGTPTFGIVAYGPGAAESHHETNDTVIEEGNILLLDFGCERMGYQSDITRTVFVGKATERAKQVYDVVYRAHLAGRAAIKPGVPCEDVDAAARKVIEDAGFGPQFFHRLGHGLGMRGHEEPNIVKGNTLPLEPGHCFSIEPGIYLAGELGVRIENIVVASQDGHISMNAEPSPTLIEI